MNAALIEALGRLASLGAAELALVSATAATLASGAASAPPRQAAPPPPPLPSAVRYHRAPARRDRLRPAARPELGATASWATSGPVDPELFASAAYRDRVGPTAPALLYAAGCEGYKTLASSIGRTVFKIGTTQNDCLGSRLSSLAATRYGSCTPQGEGWMEGEGFRFFSAANLSLQRRRGRESPIKPALRAIAIDRPASLPIRRLDHAIRAGLDGSSLHTFAASPDALVLCRDTGLDPATLDRWTPAPLGRPGRAPCRATELVLFAPRAEAEDLADLIERIIVDHVMAQEP